MVTKTFVDTKTAEKLGTSILNFFSDCGRPNTSGINVSKLNDLFTSNVEYVSNGEVIASDIEELSSWIEEIQSRFSELQYSGLVGVPICGENVFVIQYTAEGVTAGGSTTEEFYVIAILSLENGKCSSWTESVGTVSPSDYGFGE